MNSILVFCVVLVIIFCLVYVGNIILEKKIFRLLDQTKKMLETESLKFKWIPFDVENIPKQNKKYLVQLKGGELAFLYWCGFNWENNHTKVVFYAENF
jgi:hypothetical protein